VANGTDPTRVDDEEAPPVRDATEAPDGCGCDGSGDPTAWGGAAWLALLASSRRRRTSPS
jgi:MYXO-CTERM domain-containing protein